MDDDETLNIKMYGRVFRKCLEEAGALGKDLEWPKERIDEFAKILFDRFWQDQGSLWRIPRPEASKPESPR